MSCMRDLARRLALGACGIAIALVGAGLPTDTRAETKLRLTHSAPVSHPNHIAAEKMVEAIKARTNGEVVITIFPNNALGNSFETTDQVRRGVIDLTLVGSDNLDRFPEAKSIALIGAPFQFDDYAHAHTTLDKVAFDFLRKQFAAVNMMLISNYEWGFRSVSNSARPINVPDDLKGLKLRVPPVAVNKNTVEAMGATAVAIAFPELYMALSTKTVDGQENPVSTIWSAKFHEVQKHVAITHHIYTMMMFAANMRVWDRLTPTQRQIMSEEGWKAAAETRRITMEQETSLIDDLKKAGVTITMPDKAKFRAGMGRANAELRKVVGDDDWNQWQRFLEEGRKLRGP
ncbi:MAG: TRAP transporter substrate-binding protein [Alphaproteobacteria bacterium]|nr:TRAP transporter substrate-binding protein [Alphaproteobacteria bacterium]